MNAHRLRHRIIEPVIRLVETFGFQLARLDIRQNSSFHDKAIAQLMEAAGLDPSPFLNGDESQRIEILESELQTLRPFTRPDQPLGAEARAVIDSYQVIRQHLDKFGRAGIGALIVSMTRSLSDLLSVYFLARETGLMVSGEGGPFCLLPVVPLFETIKDLESGADIMDGFLKHPITRRSLPLLSPELDESVSDLKALSRTLKGNGRRRPAQMVMLGCSDSNKDSGIIASQWALQAAQNRLIEIARKQKQPLWFFHGRGGTISRGAGPTHRFLEALPSGSLDHGLRVTEQGETVAQKSTNRRTAAYNLELLIAGASAVPLLEPGSRPAETLVDAMKFLSRSSRDHYRELQMSQRRPRFMKTLEAREAALNILHPEQIRLLKEWRNAPDKRSELQLPDLLLSINAIASGLRTTG